jgi:hypothetical protein
MNKFNVIIILSILMIMLELRKAGAEKNEYGLRSIYTSKAATMGSLNKIINHILNSLMNQSTMLSTEQLDYLAELLKTLLDAKQEMQFDIASSYFSLRSG